jgi:uncharacterized protein
MIPGCRFGVVAEFRFSHYPVRLSMDRLDRIAKQHPNVEALVVAGADHTMMLGVDPKDQVDPKLFPNEAPDAPAYFALLAAWLTQHGLAH